MNDIGIEKPKKFAEIVKWFSTRNDEQLANRCKAGAPILSSKDYAEISREWKKEEHGPRTLLLHWLLYILDRRKGGEIIWNKKTAERIISIMDANDPVEEAKRLPNERVAGYPLDWYLVVRTIKYLKDYDLDLVDFLSKNINSPPDDELADFVAKVSFLLYLLSYDTKSGNLGNFKKEELSEKLENLKNQTFQLHQNRFERWLRNDRYNVNKRLWCALRDNFAIIGCANQAPEGSGWKDWANLWLEWLKKLPMFRGKEPEKISKLLMPYLEIVADVWNDRFRQNVISSILPTDEGIGARQIRELYETLWSKNYPPEDYYPMQTDIAYEFAPRMCVKCEWYSLREVCPFGSFKERDKMCHKDKNKYCSLLAFTLGWVIECKPDDCVITQDKLWGNNSLVLCKLASPHCQK
jgi:hypothetical protein